MAFALANAVLLGGVGTCIYLEVKHGLDSSLEDSLRARAADFSKLAQSGEVTLRRALAVEVEPVQLLDSDGRVLAYSLSGAGPPLLTPEQLQDALQGEVGFERREAIRVLGSPVGEGRVVVVSTSIAQRERVLETLAGFLLIGGSLILVLSSGAGYLVASGALRPVEQMRRRAAEISAATSDARLPLPPTDDEVRRLGETLNAMFSRLAAAAAHEREFLVTASHELRTPLAILKAEVDLALEDGAADNELRPALESIGEEVDRLVRLAGDLLVVARGEAGTLPIDRSVFDLNLLVARVVARFTPVSGGAVVADTQRVAMVNADRSRIEQALGNLIDNALRHGAGPITVKTEVSGATVELHVSDCGDGFTRDALKGAFTRAPGSGRAGGFGLGLPIVETIARAHGGKAEAVNARGGADVWITLPRADSA